MTDEPSNEPANRRGNDRRTALKGARIVYNDGQSAINCRIRNISEGGARLELGTAQLLPHTFELHVPGAPPRQCNLRWAKGNAVGVSFA
ncbi:MAG TPA: PilZ domain-containing protein [Dongiaceae bacterium]|jgi:hypothetical protein|nr:PilZ domain-containing protein [Dongiaceae bacterium]